MKNIFKRYICIKQHDIKDCDAACLATISKQYGLKIPISKYEKLQERINKGQVYMA
nr:cysteine peptidase family C39 domain-containing protein [Thermoanaerobacterium sp. PSU-2]